MITVQRPSGVNVGVNNPGTTIYVTGNETTDGSLRFSVDASGNIIAEERTSGVWNPAELTFSYAGHVIDDLKGELVFDETGDAVFVGEGG